MALNLCAKQEKTSTHRRSFNEYANTYIIRDNFSIISIVLKNIDDVHEKNRIG